MTASVIVEPSRFICPHLEHARSWSDFTRRPEGIFGFFMAVFPWERHVVKNSRRHAAVQIKQAALTLNISASVRPTRSYTATIPEVYPAPPIPALSVANLSL